MSVMEGSPEDELDRESWPLRAVQISKHTTPSSLLRQEPSRPDCCHGSQDKDGPGNHFPISWHHWRRRPRQERRDKWDTSPIIYLCSPGHPAPNCYLFPLLHAREAKQVQRQAKYVHSQFLFLHGPKSLIMKGFLNGIFIIGDFLP